MKKIKELKAKEFGNIKCITIEFEKGELFIEGPEASFWIDTVNSAFINDQLHNGNSAKIGETLVTYIPK